MTGCSPHELLTVLEEQGPVRATRLAAELEAHPLTVSQHCRELHADGYVRRVSADVFAVTDDGREYLTTRAE